MNKPTENIFTTRHHNILELPLKHKARILKPEQVIVKIGESAVDVGSLCYKARSDKPRPPLKPTLVVESSLLPARRKAIRQLIKTLSSMLTGLRPTTVFGKAIQFKVFMDWADNNGLFDCLAGGDATEQAFRSYATHVKDRFRQRDFEVSTAAVQQSQVLEVLRSVTGNSELGRGVRLIKDVGQGQRNGTEPAHKDDFAHALAMARMLFDGLSDLVLNPEPFPYKLKLPESLNWETGNHLWIFPTNVWRLPPHMRGEKRESGGHGNWSCDYENGRVAKVDEIWHRYRYITNLESDRRSKARGAIYNTQRLINTANNDPRHHKRIQLAMLAHNAFLLLFLAYTGGNLAVAREAETEDDIVADVVNQNYRAIKYRASGKIVTLRVPVSFMPSLRKYMRLRKYILGNQSHPYLFLSIGKYRRKLNKPDQISSSVLDATYRVFCDIDPNLPAIHSRQIRATVNDWYLRHHEVTITAKVMGHSIATENKNYGRGSAVDHRDDMTIFLKTVSESAKKQKVAKSRCELDGAAPLEQGGVCESYGHPEGMSDNPLLQPKCDDGGCWFCTHRCIVTDEEDARKIASAMCVMEQLILGIEHEDALRPLIHKCDEDLKVIAKTGNCGQMVERVKRKVFKEGELTSFWAEKYHLFLELGVIV